MADVKNVLEKIAKVEVPAAYALTCNQADEIYRGSKSAIRCIGNAFKFGYMQGLKAASKKNTNRL